MATLLTYDVSTKHTEVKVELGKLGYYWEFIQDSHRYSMPNTAVLHKNRTTSEALRDIERISKEVNATLERAFTTEIENAWIRPETPYKL